MAAFLVLPTMLLAMATTPPSEVPPVSGRAIVIRGTPGQTISDNWDALGMRASGSHDVIYDDCFVAEGAYTDLGEWGSVSVEGLIISTAGNLAYPFSPFNVPVGPAYRFSCYHLLPLEDPCEVFPMRIEELTN